MSVISKFNWYGDDKRDWEGTSIPGFYIENEDKYYHFAERNEVANGVCENAVDELLYDLRITGNSIQEGIPTAENPIEIKSVGDKTNNLLDMSPFVGIQSTLGDATLWIADDGSINASGIPTEYIGISREFNLKLSGTLTLSIHGEYDNLCCQILIRDADLNVLYTSTISKHVPSVTFNMDDCPTYNNVVLDVKRYTNDTEMSGKCYLQIEQGSTVTEYEPYGYKLPISVNDVIHNIYLTEPLRKVGDYVDYIDYKNKKVVRQVEVVDDSGMDTIENSYRGKTPTNKIINIPEINMSKGINTFDIRTEVQPSELLVEYWKQI